MGKNPKKEKTQEYFNNIRIRFPMLENECYARQTRILRTMGLPMIYVKFQYTKGIYLQ